MTLKRRLFSLTIFCLTLALLTSFQKVEKRERNALTLFAHVDRWERDQNKDYLVVTTTLTNSSSDTISYISMSCSWQEPYTTDTKALVVSISECEKNVSRLIKVPPHSKQNTILKLTGNKNADQLKNLNFKMGFNFITANSYNEMFSKVSQLTEMKNVIWSDTLMLKSIAD